jgi:hypothetical protein
LIYVVLKASLHDVGWEVLILIRSIENNEVRWITRAVNNFLRGGKMLIGDPSLSGSGYAYPFIFGPSVFTVAFCIAELDGTDSRALFIAHSLLAWPTLSEAFFLTVSIWCFRSVQRILGNSRFSRFLLCQLLAYLPVYLSVVIFFHFDRHISLLYFYPYSLFVFVFLHIPSTPLFLILSDKLIVTLCFLLTVLVQFPYSLIPLICACTGTFIWECFFVEIESSSIEVIGDDEGSPHHSRRDFSGGRSHEHRSPSPFLGNVSSLIEMGFTEYQALTALTRSGNNLQRATEFLLTH